MEIRNSLVAPVFAAALQVGTSGTWTSTPPPYVYLRFGPPGDPGANYHPTAPGGSDEVFVTSAVTQIQNPGFYQELQSTVVPAPAPFGLAALGFVFLGLRRRIHG